MTRFRLACATAATAAVLAGCSSSVAGTGTPAAAGTSATGTGTPGATASGPGAAACPGAATAADGKDLATALPDSTARNLPVEAGRTGPLSLEGLLAGQPEVQRAQIRTALTGAGFEDAYRRTWVSRTSDGRSDTEVLLVLHFGTAAGACRFVASEVTLFRLEPLAGSAVPGALGRQTKTAQWWQATAVASKGTYVFEVSGLSYRGPVATWPAGLLRDAYGRL